MKFACSHQSRYVFGENEYGPFVAAACLLLQYIECN